MKDTCFRLVMNLWDRSSPADCHNMRSGDYQKRMNRRQGPLVGVSIECLSFSCCLLLNSCVVTGSKFRARLCSLFVRVCSQGGCGFKAFLHLQVRLVRNCVSFPGSSLYVNDRESPPGPAPGTLPEVAREPPSKLRGPEILFV